jgi:cobyrinic acid a,c-diamide synthase
MIHRSEISGEPATSHSYRLRTSRGDKSEEGYHVGNVLASYAHLHFASNPTIATAFVDACASATSGGARVDR